MRQLILTVATVATIALVGPSCASLGSNGCPSMNTAGIDLFECSDGQVKVCETTEEGRCCTCDTPMSTRPAEAYDD